MSCAGYQPWRPLWLLAVLWPLALAHLVLELVHAYAWLWLVDLPLLALTALMLWRWWPRGAQAGVAAVLFVGLAWLPLAFALYAAQSVAYAMTGVFWLGRAPAHALFVGFFGSVLVAMVTRVTQGHSGRPLVMPAAAWFAFAAIQLVAVMRVAAEVLPDRDALAGGRGASAGCWRSRRGCCASAASTWRRAPTASPAEAAGRR